MSEKKETDNHKKQRGSESTTRQRLQGVAQHLRPTTTTTTTTMAAPEVKIPKTHRAAVYDDPGKVSIAIKEVETPEPGPGEVLIHL